MSRSVDNLWHRIRAARKSAKVTQQEVADKCGISRAAVAQWEAREKEKRTMPSLEYLITISKLTRKSLDWLCSAD